MENFENIKKYFINLYSLSISYLQEILDNLDNKNTKDILKNIINNNNFNKKYNKIKNIKNIDELLFNEILNTKDELNNIINIIKDINIYDELKLLSDTTKNNYDSNKMLILSLNKKIEFKYLNFINNFIIEFTKSYKYDYDNYKKIYNYYKHNPIIIDLYISIISHYLNIDNLHYKNEILLDNKLLKDNILYEYLDKNKIKYNKNKLTNINYLFKNNIIKIHNQNNIINKYNNFIVHKCYNNLNDVFLNLYNGNFQFKNNSLDNKNIIYISKILNDYYKLEKEYISIIILESNFDNYNYNLSNLLNKKYELVQNQGIDIKYINKTKTIVTNKEIKELPKSDLKYKNDIYIQNIDKMTIITNYNLLKKINDEDKKKILLDTNFNLIYKIDDLYYILKECNSNHAFIKYNDISLLLQNNANYYIENYNTIFENNVLQYIKDNNMLDMYNEKINLDYKNIPKIDNLELKNKILNKIKKNIKNINNVSKKIENINEIIEIMIDEIYIYIQKINNIEFNSEIYLTYYSNINNIINKIKKELNDNYDENIINNIDSIINNLYSNILKINDNLLDKYYILNL